MIYYFILIQILMDFIRRTVFPQEQIETIQRPVESDQPTESTDCSCPTVFSNDHPPDLKRLLGIYKLVHETIDPLFLILEPMHTINPFRQLGHQMTFMLLSLSETCAEARFLAKKAAEDVEKELRNEPIYQPGDIRIIDSIEERSWGLPRRLRTLQIMEQMQQQLQQ